MEVFWSDFVTRITAHLPKKNTFFERAVGDIQNHFTKKNHKIETFIYSREPGVSFIENNPISKTGHARAL